MLSGVSHLAGMVQCSTAPKYYLECLIKPGWCRTLLFKREVLQLVVTIGRVSDSKVVMRSLKTLGLEAL
jgi:hypothetical protein